MRPDDFERARPHLTAMGEVAGGELDALAAVADRNPPVLRSHDETGRRVDEVVRQWMTEKTGGSDVGASTAVARPEPDGTWRLSGDKWFCSVANAGAALTLARPEGAPPGTRGLAMFVPRILADGARNAWTLNRLKDKFGSRSMATGEVTFDGAVAYPVGDVAGAFSR